MSVRHSFGAMLLALATLSATGCTSGTPGSSPGTEAPALVGTDLDGHDRDLAELRGTTVLVTVWASWCTPCREEIPEIQRLYEEHGGEGFAVLGVDFRDEPQSARAFVEEFGVTYPSIDDRRGISAIEWGITGVPQSYLVDAGGTIVARQIGPVTSQWIDEHVLPELEK